MATNLPTYIGLDQATEQYGIPTEALTAAVEDGTLKAIQTADDEILVAVEDVQVLAERLEPAPVDPELAGKPIRAAEAVRKYNITDVNLSRWANAGYIRVLRRGPKLLVLDEGDVQRAAELFLRAHEETGSYVRAGWVLKRALSIPCSSSASQN